MMTPADLQREWSRFMDKLSAMPRAAEIARKVRVGCTAADVVYAEDRLRLLRYRPEAPRRYRTPLVVVFALVNRPYILDLKPGKSVVAHFLKGGFDVLNVDWGVPTPTDRWRGMAEYVEGYLDRIIDWVREDSGCERVNVLGYCMGGSLSAMYTALHPEKVRNLIMLAAPVDWSSRQHLLAKWCDPRVLDVDRLIDTYGNAPAEMLQGSFLLLRPVATLVEKYVTFWENVEDEKYLEDFFAMETWLNDNIPVAGEMFRQFVKYCMQENRLMQGRLDIGGRRVDLQRITCPLLNLTAEHDHLVPCGQCLPLNDVVGSTDRKAVTFQAGHIGLAVGSRAQRDLWPKACEWLAERSEEL
jgi:polyhydroxyalkanoate synthase